MGAAESRREKIVREVTQAEFLSVVELAEMFNVTTATICTDLNALEEEHLIIRFYS